MTNHRLVRWVCALGLAVYVWLGCFLPAEAQALPTIDWTTPAGSATMPDFSQLSMGDFATIQAKGGFAEGTWQRTWQNGQSLDTLLTLGDLASLEPQALTLGGISQITGQSLADLSLNTVPLVARQPLGSLVEAVPSLGAMPLKAVPPIAALLQQQAIDLIGERTLRTGITLYEALRRFPELSNLNLDSIDLSAFAIASLPGLMQTALGDFPGWETATLNGIPGLSDLPLAAFPNPVAPVGGEVMRIDRIWAPEEGERQRTISGSDVEGFEVPCYQDRQDCASIELDDLENEGQSQRSALEGVHWVSGKYQQVKGGSGALGLVNGGMEPTGRLPFGDLFKVVVWEPDETTDTVTTALFFRACQPLAGCTPYVIGPVPFLTLKANDLIVVGQLDYTGNPAAQPSQPTGATKGGGMPGIADFGFDLNCLINPTTLAGAIAQAPTGEGEPKVLNKQPQSNNTPQGIDLNVLASAIATIESQGSGGYQAIGVYTCADGGRNCGRALGRYQFMSYNEFAVATISQRPGGQAFLARMNAGATPTATEIMQVFPPEDQDRAFKSSLASNINKASREIDPRTGQVFTGDRLIERAAQMHFGGQYSQIDGAFSDELNGLTLKDYGEKALALYKQGGGSAAGLCSPQASGGSDGSAAQAGAINQRIATATKMLRGFNTRNAPGTDGGNNACAWMVNRVLQEAGVAPVGANPLYVPSVAQDLKAGRGQRVSSSQAKAGDIITSKGYEHIGICLSDGCTRVLSNSSSNGAFVWESDRTFGGYYDRSQYLQEAPTEEIYRVVR